MEHVIPIWIKDVVPALRIDRVVISCFICTWVCRGTNLDLHAMSFAIRVWVHSWFTK